MVRSDKVSIEELRTNLAELIGRVMYGKEQVVITKYNRQAAVLVHPEEFEKLVNPHKRFNSEEWLAKFDLFEGIKEKNDKVSQEELERDLEAAVEEVRERKKK